MYQLIQTQLGSVDLFTVLQGFSAVLQTHLHLPLPLRKINIQMELTLNAAINYSGYSAIY